MRYQNPPLIEAVVGFKFARSKTPWDIIYFGKLHDRLQTAFPHLSKLSTEQTEVPVPSVGSMAVSVRPDLKRFTGEDGGVVITIGPTSLGISMLHRQLEGGHPGWEVLQDHAGKLFAIYTDVTEPDGAVEIGVRYVNSIEIDPGNFKLGDVLDPSSGLIPKMLENEDGPFSFRLDHIRTDKDDWSQREILHLRARMIHKESEKAELLLDIDEIFIVGEGRVFQGDPTGIGNMLHDSVYELFDRAVRKEIRASFGTSNANLERSSA